MHNHYTMDTDNGKFGICYTMYSGWKFSNHSNYLEFVNMLFMLECSKRSSFETCNNCSFQVIQVGLIGIATSL